MRVYNFLTITFALHFNHRTIIAFHSEYLSVELVQNREIFIPHLYLASPQGWPRRNFVKVFDAGKTRMIGLPYGNKNCDDMLSRFHMIPERNGRTDRRTDLLYQYRASVCWRAIKIDFQYYDFVLTTKNKKFNVAAGFGRRGIPPPASSDTGTTFGLDGSDWSHDLATLTLRPRPRPQILRLRHKPRINSNAF